MAGDKAKDKAGDKTEEGQGLVELRSSIDAIDGRLLELLNRRAQIAREVAETKERDIEARGGDATTAFFYRPEREAQVLHSLQASNPGPLPAASLRRIFKEVIASCLALEQPLEVAYLGPPGTYSEAALQGHFGGAVARRSCAGIDEVFREVESGLAHYGMVPVENSTEGMVNLTLDSLVESSLSICGEVELPIHHYLLGAGTLGIAQAVRLYSHQQSFAQCRKWLDQHCGGLERIAVSSNGEAARLAVEQPEALAIAGEFTAHHYGLSTIARNIEDRPDNSTRFIVVGRQQPGPSGNDKTSILATIRNEAGALLRVLEPFRDLGINLTRIETRPARHDKWAYVFFIDFLGHREDAQVEQVLEKLLSMGAQVKMLGSYPRAMEGE